MENNKKNTRKLFSSILWLLVGITCVTLLVAAINRKESKICKGIEINITGVSNNFFIDKNDVYSIIKNNGGDTAAKKSLEDINLKNIEIQLEKDVWIKDAELYFDNNNILNVSVEEREPIARVFAKDGNTFYIDSSCKVLPLSEKFSARVPVFTSYNGTTKYVSEADSLLLISIKELSIAMAKDSFLMAMIEQVDILPKKQFEMIPKIGRQKILFGTAEEATIKFKKLKLFYKNVIAQTGWNKYSVINLQYKDQVVASIKGAADVSADSLQTMQLMQSIVDNATLRSSDSSQTFVADADKNNVDSSLIEQSVEREDEGETPVDNAAVKKMISTAVPVIVASKKPVTILKPATVKPTITPVKPPISKPAAIAVTKTVTAVAAKPKPIVITPKPKPKPKPLVVMPKPKPKPIITKTNNKPVVKKKTAPN
jgi:cell division protein FtsQ